MRWRHHVLIVSLAAVPVATASCGGAGGGSTALGSGSSGGGSSGAAGSSSGSGAGTSGGSSGLAAIGSSGGGDDDGGGGSRSGSGSGAGSSGSSGGSTGGSSGGTSSGGPGPDGGSSGSATCTKGQVANDEVVMIGDSYMDLANTGPTIMKDANNATYRHYYLSGAAMAYGSLNFNIPYQFDTLAETDTAVAMPNDIKVVIMDGGGNDVLIDNSMCLTTPVAGDTTCHTAIQNSVAKGQQLEMDMASKSVEHVVYYFYPDLDPTVSGHQYAGAWVDYAYPLAAASCCGAANVPASGDLSCRGNAQGVDCIWIDTRPEFVGHNDHTNAASYWFMGDNIHPTQPGADAIAAKVWAKMQEFCIAQ